MLSRKDYQEIANILHNFEPVKSDIESIDGFNIRKRQFISLVTTFANHFKIDNPRFDLDKFEEAIYGES